MFLFNKGIMYEGFQSNLIISCTAVRYETRLELRYMIIEFKKTSKSFIYHSFKCFT